MDSRRLHTRLRFGLFAVLVALGACGGTGFDKPSIVKGVRILAVQKDPAYPLPGETVHLTMLYWDGKRSDSGRRPVQVVWFGGEPGGFNCINPKGDLYYGCFGSTGTAIGSDASAPDAGAIADAGAIDDAGVAADAGVATDAGPIPAPALADHVSTHSAVIPPADVILKPIPPQEGSPYGLEYVFFAACAGQIGFVPPGASPNTLPVGCFGPGGQLLGPDDFVPGYSSIYVYTDRRNANPIVSNLLLDGAPIGSATGPAANTPRFPRCTAGSSVDCPAHAVQVQIDKASAETDPSGLSSGGTPLREQLWVAFYGTAGDFKHELRLVNDAEQGWNEDNGTDWHVPMTPGPVRLWGVVHDNRGGVAWAEGEVIVE